MWIFLAFASAFFLGLYDSSKKVALQNNAVIPVLFLNVLFCSLFFGGLIGLSYWAPQVMGSSLLTVPVMPVGNHLYIFGKSALVLSSWICVYFAMKHLPLTLVGPVRASQPVLTLLGALTLFGERLNTYQWIGVLIALFSFYLLALSGKKEGVDFKADKWVLWMAVGTVLGSCSGLYDKYLMQTMPAMGVQAWYNVYQLLIMLPILSFLWYPQRKKSTPFQWRGSILLISLFLTIADMCYFYALSMPDSMISIVSMVRRSGVIVSFMVGAFLLKEKNIKSKAFDLLLMLLAMIFLFLGTYK